MERSERQKAFREDLEKLLEKHGAEIELDNEHSGSAYISVWLKGYEIPDGWIDGELFAL